MKHLKLFESFYDEEQHFENRIIREVANFYYQKTGVEYIASGAFGDAFLLSKDNTKVLKVTDDSDEALNADILRKLNIKGIVEYYDVREIIVNGESKGLYSILMERLKKPTNLEKRAFSLIKDTLLSDDGTNGLNLDYRGGLGTSEKYRLFLKLNPPEKIEEFIEILNSPFFPKNEEEQITFYEKYYSQSGWRTAENFTETLANNTKYLKESNFLTILKEYYFFYINVVKDFMKYKIKLDDFHLGNLGMKDVLPVAIDVGCRQFRKNAKLTLKPIEINFVEEDE